MSKAGRILFVSDNPHLPQTHGGVEWNTHELCNALSKRGVSAAVLCSVDSTGRTGWVNRLKRRTGLWGRWPSDRQMGYTVFRGWDPGAGVRDVIERWRPDCVIVQGSTPDFGLQAMQAGVPAFFYFHHAQADLAVDGEWRNLDGFFACSPFLAARQQALYGVEIKPLRPLVRHERCRTDVVPEVLLSFGLQPIKGADIVLDVAAARPDIPVLIVETWTKDKPATERLRDRARKLPNVQIAAPRNDVREFLRKARLLVAASRWDEPWGRVVTEAQINGIPVLASARGGLPEVVGTGGLCLGSSATSADYVAAVARFWDDENYYRAMSAAASTAARRDELQEQTIVDSLLSMLGQAIASHAQAQAQARVRSHTRETS